MIWGEGNGDRAFSFSLINSKFDSIGLYDCGRCRFTWDLVLFIVRHGIGKVLVFGSLFRVGILVFLFLGVVSVKVCRNF